MIVGGLRRLGHGGGGPYLPNRLIRRWMESLPTITGSDDMPDDKILYNGILVKWEPLLPSLELSEPQLTRIDVQKAVDEYHHWLKTIDLPTPIKKETAPFINAFSKWSFINEFTIWRGNVTEFGVRYKPIERKQLWDEKQLMKQAFDPIRHGTLGPDLATSHFVVYRGGKVRFKDHDKWCVLYQSLPNSMDKKLRVVELDASLCNLAYEGLDNLIKLKYLEFLDLSENPLLDDWAMDRLACHLRNSHNLRFLNLSGNLLITSRGIESLVRLPTLETLIITGTGAARSSFIELTLHLFEEINPNCKIVI
ncbi:distal membrane arm assembly component 2 [Brevipalpus obovatus]|uniref:distal membrane arm assembly component 2 n=1 Tax=Brevipalpus obovatus TaxID=246614 RepID=UPI003D9DE093